MFYNSQKPTGTGYTTPVAFLIVALVFIPAALMFFANFGRVAVVLAIGLSVACLGMAWRSWKKSSRLTIPSIGQSEVLSK